MIVGFCCQYGLYGTGTLSSLWRSSNAGIWIVPVLCAAKVEEDHMLRAFEMGAEGVFIAGCGEQCSRENTAYWLGQSVEKVRKALGQMGLDPERVQAFASPNNGDTAEELEKFTERIGGLYLASILIQEVKS